MKTIISISLALSLFHGFSNACAVAPCDPAETYSFPQNSERWIYIIGNNTMAAYTSLTPQRTLLSDVWVGYWDAPAIVYYEVTLLEDSRLKVILSFRDGKAESITEVVREFLDLSLRKIEDDFIWDCSDYKLKKWSSSKYEVILSANQASKLSEFLGKHFIKLPEINFELLVKLNPAGWPLS